MNVKACLTPYGRTIVDKAREWFIAGSDLEEIAVELHVPLDGLRLALTLRHLGNTYGGTELDETLRVPTFVGIGQKATNS